jgi:Protein of unknown function (DUF3761)
VIFLSDPHRQHSSLLGGRSQLQPFCSAATTSPPSSLPSAPRPSPCLGHGPSVLPRAGCRTAGVQLCRRPAHGLSAAGWRTAWTSPASSSPSAPVSSVSTSPSSSPAHATSSPTSAPRAPSPSPHTARSTSRRTAAPTPSSVPAASKSTARTAVSAHRSTGARAGSCGHDYYRNSSGACIYRPVTAPSTPAGETSQCSDGSYSFSSARIHRGGSSAVLQRFSRA